MTYDELIWSKSVCNLGDEEFEFELELKQREKFNTAVPGSNIIDESYTSAPSTSIKQLRTVHSNLFEIIQIYPTDISKEIPVVYRRLARSFHPK